MTHGIQTFCFIKGPECFTQSHLQVGELLLLMGDGLLHQHTLNALFHGILLCLREKRTKSWPVWTSSVQLGMSDHTVDDFEALDVRGALKTLHSAQQWRKSVWKACDQDRKWAHTHLTYFWKTTRSFVSTDVTVLAGFEASKHSPLCNKLKESLRTYLSITTLKKKYYIS